MIQLGKLFDYYYCYYYYSYYYCSYYYYYDYYSKRLHFVLIMSYLNGHSTSDFASCLSDYCSEPVSWLLV